MDLVKITDLTPQLGLTSRSLRYYEEAGLIQSVRLPGEKYRYFDAANIERLKQIIVLRKMMVPIKDILRIYESDDMSVVVQVFVSRIEEIDREAAALTELRQVTDDFLKTMLKNGVRNISALPLLYEAFCNQELEQVDARENNSISYDELSAISENLAKPVEPSILLLPSMRVLSSYLKEDNQVTDPDGFWHWVQSRRIMTGGPGSHEQFEYQTAAGDVYLLKMDDDFVNDSKYMDCIFEGGLFASVNVYLDEDLGERLRSLVSFFDDNKYYEVDYVHGGGLRQEAMLENLISPDEKRELVALLIPIKKRLASSELFGRPEELECSSVTVEEIEKANPVLWSEEIPMDKLIPINSPFYRVTEQGEAEYISWISTRVLSTGMDVKIPFRVDMEFRVGEDSGGYGHGMNEGSIRFHHGEDLNYMFGINMDNNPDERLSQEAICFHQPVFGDYHRYPKRGGIRPGVYNRLTWIVGLKHFAVIINDEIRYCGVNFPYMSADLSCQKALPVVIGSNSSIKKYFRSIRVSQLMQQPKIKIKEGALIMITKQSNNMIPDIHRLITSEYGENYWFDGCARYVMESVGEYTGEPDFGYCFFAGLTGDVLAQVYSYGVYMGEGVSACSAVREGGSYFERIFEKCGYAGTFVAAQQLAANKEMYIQTLITYIDKGVPVITFTYGGPPMGVYVGYEEYGKILLFLTGDRTEPERIPVDRIIDSNEECPSTAKGWFFIGEKKRKVSLRQLYRDIIFDMPKLLTVKNEEYCFGPEAFRAWAEGIENGKLDSMKPEEFDDGWAVHVSNICNMATNGSCSSAFFRRVMELNPDLTFLDEVIRLYERTAQIWNNDNGNDLEALGGGFNVTLQNLQDESRRVRIAAKIKEAAECMDRVLSILDENLGKMSR